MESAAEKCCMDYMEYACVTTTITSPINGTMNDVAKCNTFHNMTALSYFSGTTSIVLLLTTCSVNTLLVTILLKNTKLLRESIFYKLIFNIAIADLLTGLISDVTSALFHIEEGLRNPVPSHVTKLLHAALFFINGVSVLTMAVKCFERVIAIVYPIYYRKGIKAYTCYIIIFSTWLCSGLLIIPYFYVGYIRYLKIFSFATVSIAFISLLSALVIYKIHLKPVIRISANICATNERNGARNNDNNNNNNNNNKKNDHYSNKYTTNRLSQQSRKAEKRVNLSFLIMLMVFLVTYLPAAIMVLYMNTCHDCDCTVIHLMRDFTYLLILSSATWRPLNFILRLRTIRQEVRNVIKVNCSKVEDVHTTELSSPVVLSRTRTNTP